MSEARERAARAGPGRRCDLDPWAVFAVANGRPRKGRVKLGECTPSDTWLEERAAPVGLVIVCLSDSGQTWRHSGLGYRTGKLRRAMSKQPSPERAGLKRFSMAG